MSSSPSQPGCLLVELCTGGIDDVFLGAQYGVDRIELNTGMAVGGLTPPAGLVAEARKEFAGPIIAMVRPREGGFAYSNAEYLQMLRDTELLIASGMDGIATGFLTTAGNVDVERCREIRMLVPKATLVFHRAFDVTAVADLALRQLIDCGFNRILTSGGMPTALEGAAILKRLHERAAGKIEILPAGGIRASNAVGVISQTGCNQIHSAVREATTDPSRRNNLRIRFGPEGHDNGSYGQASAEHLQKLLNAVKHLRDPEPDGGGT
jgi:copper homeostasis protein